MRFITNVDENGVISFTHKQWRGLLKITGSKAKSVSGQRKAIKKLIEEALKRVLNSEVPPTGGVI